MTVEKGYGFFRNLVLMHLNHFIQVFFIPVFANSLIEQLKNGGRMGEGGAGEVFSHVL